MRQVLGQKTGTQRKLTNEKGTQKKIEQRDGYLKSQTLQIIRELDQKMTKTPDSSAKFDWSTLQTKLTQTTGTGATYIYN